MGYIDEQANLAGKTAIVLGGAQGIGAAVTLALARAGVDVAVCDVDQAALAKLEPEVADLGHLRLARVTDVCEPDQLNDFFTAFDEVSDRLDIVVNVAGGVVRRLFMETTPEEWERDHRLNFQYVLHAVQQAVPRIRAGGRGGSVVSFTTIEAHRACPGFAVYAAYKAALTNMTRSFAVELGADGIRFNTIAVEVTPTPGMFSTRPPESWPDFEEPRTKMIVGIYVPLKRVGSPEDHANAVLFLASDLSAWTTGTALHVDGGAWAASGWLEWPEGGFGLGPSSVPKVIDALFSQ